MNISSFKSLFVVGLNAWQQRAETQLQQWNTGLIMIQYKQGEIFSIEYF